MNRHLDRWLRFSFSLALLLCLTAHGVSQDDMFEEDAAAIEDDDPFGDATDAADTDVDAGEDEDTSAGRATPTARDSGGTAAAEVPPIPSSTENQAAVNVILASQPQTAEQLLQAIDQLLRLNRPDAAQPLWDKLLAAPMDDAGRARLHEKFGTAALIRLSRSRDLTPAPAEFVSQIFAAARRVADDPARLKQLADLLNSDERETRFQAAVQLLRAGSRAVPVLMESLSTATDPPSTATPIIMEIFQRLGADAVDPLIAFQSSDEETARVNAIRGLAVANQPGTLPYLVQSLFAPRSSREAQVAEAAWKRMTGRVPDRTEAVELLRRAAERAYAGDAGSAASNPNEQTRWIWSTTERRPIASTVSPADSAALNAARLYRDLWQHDARSDDPRRYLTSRLAVEQTLVGLDQPLPRGDGSLVNESVSLGSWVLSQVLAEAMHDGHDISAIAASEVLGATQDMSALQAKDTQLSPLGLALTHPNARVRFAAAQAIAQLNPAQPFAGQGHWEDALHYFSRSEGQRLAIVAHPQPAYAQKFAGLLSEFGYQTRTATTSQQLLKLATESPDVELILVSDAMNEETIWANLESLRSGPKTARIPIAILSRVSRLDEMQLIAEDQPRTLVLAETIDGPLLATVIPRLHELAGRDFIPVERRLEQATAARGWIQARRVKFDGDRTSPLKN